jgi:plasmid maintenance system antidote protein VapI
MGKIDDTRRKNARLLAEAAGGPAKFARKVGITDSRASQLIGANFTRNIGDKTAALIENAFDKNPGWLDQDVDLIFTNGTEATLVQLKPPAIPSKNVSLVYVTQEELDVLTSLREADEKSRNLILIAAKNIQKDEAKLRNILK